MNRFPLYQIFLCFFLCSLIVNCASLTDRKQYLRVVPNDADTEIFYEGQKVGKGLSTIQIRRGKKPKLEFRSRKGSETLTLKTKYRWGHSFGGNALMVSLAPYGWVTDIITGAAWHADDVVKPVMDFEVDESSQVLILPPTLVNATKSKALGKKLQKWLEKKYPKANILNFTDNYELVFGLGFDHESSVITDDYGNYADLLFETKATHLVFSEYDVEKKDLVYKIFSPYSEKYVAKARTPKLKIAPEKSVSWLYSEFFEAFPNTISLGIQNTAYSGCATNLNQDLPRYCANEAKKTPLNIISSISLTNILHYRKRKPWRLYLRFYPDINISFNEVTFEKASPDLADIGIDWAFLALGYGPRLSFIVPVGEIFFEIVPIYSLNYIKLYSTNFSETRWVGQFGASAQFGFNTWIANHWNMRFYSRVYAADIIYSDLSRVDPGTRFDGVLAVAQTGIYIGYYFHEEKTKLFKWLF